MSRGLFITIEGIEGVGKSTMLQFLYHYLQNRGIKCLATREPGGTPIAETIRQILLNHHSELMCIKTELLLLFAGRAQHVAQVIEPALQQGLWVICDRFTDASLAYQGAGRGISTQSIYELTHWVLGDFKPDLTLLLDAPVKIGLQRLQQRGERDRIEQEEIDFFERVRAGYLQLAAAEATRFRQVQADQSTAEVQQQLLGILEPFICEYCL